MLDQPCVNLGLAPTTLTHGENVVMSYIVGVREREGIVVYGRISRSSNLNTLKLLHAAWRFFLQVVLILELVLKVSC